MDNIQPGDVGYGAVKSFSPNQSALAPPDALVRLIAMARAKSPELSGGSKEAASNVTQNLAGLTPMARRALEAILIRNVAGNGMADIGAKAMVDNTYGSQGLM
jgi:hypothetical protein